MVWYVRIRKGFQKYSTRVQDQAKLLSKYENRVGAILGSEEFCRRTGGFDLEVCNWINNFINFTRTALSEVDKDQTSDLTSSERDLLQKSKRNQT